MRFHYLPKQKGGGIYQMRGQSQQDFSGKSTRQLTGFTLRRDGTLKMAGAFLIHRARTRQNFV
jgi:hypothetical protein